jgi:L-lactate dehydrogenase complex protein LldF
MMRHWREREFEAKLAPKAMRRGLGFWAWFARRPRTYRRAARLGGWFLRRLAREGKVVRLPFGGNWTRDRDLPAPQGQTFMDQWKALER